MSDTHTTTATTTATAKTKSAAELKKDLMDKYQANLWAAYKEAKGEDYPDKGDAWRLWLEQFVPAPSKEQYEALGS